jgi:hypothetical protein
MISPATLAILVVPAIGLCFVLGLFISTAIADKRALRRADDLERKVAM